MYTVATFWKKDVLKALFETILIGSLFWKREVFKQTTNASFIKTCFYFHSYEKVEHIDLRKHRLDTGMILPTAIEVIWCPMLITLVCQKVATNSYKPRCVQYTLTPCLSCYVQHFKHIPLGHQIASIAVGKSTLVSGLWQNITDRSDGRVLEMVAISFGVSHPNVTPTQTQGIIWRALFSFSFFKLIKSDIQNLLLIFHFRLLLKVSSLYYLLLYLSLLSNSLICVRLILCIFFIFCRRDSHHICCSMQ